MSFVISEIKCIIFPEEETEWRSAAFTVGMCPERAKNHTEHQREILKRTDG